MSNYKRITRREFHALPDGTLYKMIKDTTYIKSKNSTHIEHNLDHYYIPLFIYKLSKSKVFRFI